MVNIDDWQDSQDYFDDRYVQPPYDPWDPTPADIIPPWDPYKDDFNNFPTVITPPPADPPPWKPPSYTGGPNTTYQAPQRSAPSSLNYPSFDAPRFNAPAPFAFDPFSYESFKAPTLAEAQAEPGFEFALNQGLKAMENSKAYLGTYRTGGTIKGLNDYARGAANQNYNNVFERSGQTYDRNRGNAFGAWQGNRENAADAYATNYNISRDVFDRNYTAAKDEYAPKARATELQFNRDWDQYAYEGDDEYRRWKAMVDANS